MAENSIFAAFLNLQPKRSINRTSGKSTDFPIKVQGKEPIKNILMPILSCTFSCEAKQEVLIKSTIFELLSKH